MNDHDDRVFAQVTPEGRLDLPEAQRRLVGLEAGGTVIVRVEEGELRIRSLDASLKALQAEASALFAGSGESVDRFLAERRASFGEE